MTLLHFGKANKFVLRSTYATLSVTKSAAMSEKELNAYRLTSMEEPTDEMLSCIMKEAAEEARNRWEQAEKSFFDHLRAITQKSASAV